uniref:Haloacid dehalogenase like hydrolase domain containing 5 n=1 Tax=Amphilophus citrinellus TaxID=61819 RepID=A0A3Q0S7U2_AMPCI
WKWNGFPRSPLTLTSCVAIAIILFGEPVRWETNLQLLIDVLLTNGRPDCVYEAHPSAQLPVLACNMDLLWMAEAPSDNLMTDIYGANLYNRYLTQQHASVITKTRLAGRGTGSEVMVEEEPISACQCRSILVRTGVYNSRFPLPRDQSSSITETVFHGHRDMVLEPDLMEPSHVVEDVEAAVDLLLHQEGSDL